MTRLEARSELSRRWSEWVLRCIQRGMRRVLWIVLCLSPKSSLRLESELGKGSEFIIRVPSSLGCREAAS